MRPGSRREVVLCAVFVLIALGWIVTGLRADSGELHEAPVVLVGPDVVTVPLVKQVNAVPGRPFSAGAVDNRAEAAELLERGDVVAELDIDLSGTQDELRLATAHRPTLARAVQAEVTRIEKTRGRTVVLAAPPDRLEGRPLSWVTFATALAGFLLVCVVSLVWGPFARTLPRLLARLTALAALAVGAGVFGWLLAGPAPAGERMLVASVLAATVVAAGALTFACEIIGGLPGLLLAATVIVAGPVPLLLAGDRLLLADAWAIGSGWTITGAGESLLWAASGDGVTGIAQPVVTIAGSALLGLVVLVAMRWLVRVDVERPGALASVRSWRRNLGLVLASATCLTILATALTSALHSEAVPRPLASLASTTQCVPAGPVEDVDDLNRITRLRAEPALQGGAAAVSGKWLYLYGTAREPDPPLGTGFALHVARVAPDHVADPDRWTYWDGSGWNKRPGSSSELIPAADGVSQTLSVFERDGRWYAFSKSGEFLGSDLVFWTSSSPTGPFRAQPPVGTLPSGVARGELRYMPLAHPDILEQPGSVIVSYSRNSTDFGAVLRNPLLYRPKFIRVDLPDR